MKGIVHVGPKESARRPPSIPMVAETSPPATAGKALVFQVKHQPGDVEEAVVVEVHDVVLLWPDVRS